MKYPIAPALLLLALAACGNDNAQRQQGGKAEGQILPASVSDAMIPVDQVKSQAPLAPKSEGGAKKDGKPTSESGESPAPEASADAAGEASPAETTPAG